MSVKKKETHDPKWNRVSATKGSKSVVLEEFDSDDEPTVWVHDTSENKCIRLSIDELLELVDE